MVAAISLDKLTKYYGTQRGVIDLNLEVPAGIVFGYLGPNGAGKTTTMRILLDLIRPTTGSAKIFGISPQTESVDARRQIGYLPADPALYENLTGAELLTFLANLKGGVEPIKIKLLADRLESDLSRKIGTLSHGNRQKIAIIRAFMHEPQLLILDEPTNGLDPLMQQEFVRIVKEVKSSGRTVFLSSHIIPEVEEICDRVAVIREGRLIAIDDVSVLKARSVRRLQARVAEKIPPNAFDNIEGVRNVVISEVEVACDVSGSLDQFIKAVAKFEVLDMNIQEPTLEDEFFAMYEGDS